MKRSAVAFAVFAMINLGLVSQAEASTDTATPTESGHLAALVERTRASVDHDGSDHQFARSAPPTAFAIGDCGEAGAFDPDEGFIIDIDVSGAFADCNGVLSAAVITYDTWADAELSAFAVRLDTDRNASTGCQGFEYTIIVIEDAGTFPGVIFPEVPSCADTDPIAGVGAGRGDDPRFIGVWWNSADIGSPSSFAFTTATSSVYSDNFDFSPDVGAPLPVLTVAGTTPPPPTPVPSARSIAPACTFDGGFEDGFDDVPTSSSHEAPVDCIVYWQVTTGLGPGVYNPSGGVTREQMASFLARFVERSGGTLPTNPADAFPDDNGSVHEPSINKLAAAGIVSGRSDGTFGPALTVNRAQMATFIIRALEYRLGGPVNDGAPAPDYFTDDDGNTHEPNINKAASIGITGGTGGTNYSPSFPVRRDQMASFLARGLAELVDAGTTSIPEPPPKCVHDSSIESTDGDCTEPSPPPPSECSTAGSKYTTANGVCIDEYDADNNGDINCTELPAAAKPVTVKTIGDDPYVLDADGDGVACES